MGVTGLWRLIEPAGKPVPIETLENKVLAVDISIWLHQVVKGYQDAKGAPLPNAHLMGLFQRLCKLLYFRIKPVFVFDGGFPELKRETIAKRQDNKTKYNSESERLKREIALLLGKKSAIGALLGSQISPKKTKNTQSSAESDDIFRLPALPQKEEESESESDDEQNSSASTIDLHSVDIESEDFKNMPVKEKYDLLVELKETRKMNSWGKLHTLPKKSDNFSDFQMQRLLKRRKVQECLQETEKEMGDVGMSLNDLESLLNEEGIETKIENLPTRRIASNNTTRYLLINNVQQALADAKKREEAKSSHIKEKEDIDIKDESEDELQKAIQMSLECEGKSSETDNETFRNKKDELEEDLDKAIKMSSECVEEPNTSASKTDDSWTSYKSDLDYSDIASDSEDGDGYEQPDFSTAKAYIMQYSDLTHNAINDIVSSEVTGTKNKRKCPEVDKIIEELNHERSIIADKVNLCSDEDEDKPNLDMVNIIYPNQSEQLKPKPHVNNRDIFKEIESSMESEDKTQDHIVDMDTTQSSVLYIDKPSDEVVILDTSSEEILERRPGLTATNIVPSANNSDSSDDEFEEVPETVGPHKPIVQVTLNVTDTIEDDIFADVFETKGPVVNKDRETHNDRNQIETNIIADRVKPIDIDPKQDENIKSKSGENQEPCVNEMINPEIKCNKDNIETKHNANSQSKVRQKQVQDVIMKPESMCDKVNIDNILPKSNPCQSESSIDLDNVCLTSQATVNKESCPPEKAVKNVISTDKLHSMVSEIENEEKNLQQEKGRMERIGRNITEQMTKEAQELLQIFGIPYIVAPMEAEAQCAFLESVNLTDGTITDDSDIWLFGGKTVYKNFFNQKKHVLQFLSERIEKSYNLSREQLILLALLVGSDYTTGVSGVGPVTALEILAAFPLNKRQLLKETSKHGQYQHIVTGLQEFQKWVLAGRRTDNINLKKKLRNVTLSDDFPSVRVVQAYMDPNVEKSKEKFTWGQLDITILRDYAKAKFGWSQNKLDVILQPVIKRMLERKTQKTVQDYFKRKINFESLEDQMSKRVKAAVQKMVPETENGDFILSVHQNPTQQDTKVSKKRKVTKQDGVASTSSAVSKEKKNKMVKNDKVSFTTNNGIEINIPKIDRYQELIPQREKDMQNNLQAKLKAIEIFRKTKIDIKRKPVKKKVNLPKDNAELSETSDSD